jgi:hypothetical protein
MKEVIVREWIVFIGLLFCMLPLYTAFVLIFGEPTEVKTLPEKVWKFYHGNPFLFMFALYAALQIVRSLSWTAKLLIKKK